MEGLRVERVEVPEEMEWDTHWRINATCYGWLTLPGGGPGEGRHMITSLEALEALEELLAEPAEAYARGVADGQHSILAQLPGHTCWRCEMEGTQPPN